MLFSIGSYSTLEESNALKLIRDDCTNLKWPKDTIEDEDSWTEKDLVGQDQLTVLFFAQDIECR